MKLLFVVVAMVMLLGRSDACAQDFTLPDSTSVRHSNGTLDYRADRRFDQSSPALQSTSALSSRSSELKAAGIGAAFGAVAGYFLTRGLQGLGDSSSSGGEARQRIAGTVIGAALGASIGLLIASLGAD